MTDRDYFAAAALTGLLYPDVDDEFAMSYIVGRAYLWADAMLRERCRAGADCPASDNAPSHDAAPAARASEATASPERVRVRGDAGTGDTDHGASPEAIASVGRPRTDKADLPTRAGTGDTPATHATRGEGSEQRECTEPKAARGLLERLGGAT